MDNLEELIALLILLGVLDGDTETLLKAIRNLQRFLDTNTEEKLAILSSDEFAALIP